MCLYLYISIMTQRVHALTCVRPNVYQLYFYLCLWHVLVLVYFDSACACTHLCVSECHVILTCKRTCTCVCTCILSVCTHYIKRVHTHTEDTEALKKVSPSHTEANGAKKNKNLLFFVYTKRHNGAGYKSRALSDFQECCGIGIFFVHFSQLTTILRHRYVTWMYAYVCQMGVCICMSHGCVYMYAKWVCVYVCHMYVCMYMYVCICMPHVCMYMYATWMYI
jgi:hypothetical protein